ncbi:hypothetical protein FOA52_001516 [Chlamydomonas sp. UWO 241]|nr:hypothetical protein FOA52_001516 [Chlamydomonas sp. UWO 241]
MECVASPRLAAEFLGATDDVNLLHAADGAGPQSSVAAVSMESLLLTHAKAGALLQRCNFAIQDTAPPTPGILAHPVSDESGDEIGAMSDSSRMGTPVTALSASKALAAVHEDMPLEAIPHAAHEVTVRLVRGPGGGNADKPASFSVTVLAAPEPSPEPDLPTGDRRTPKKAAAASRQSPVPTPSPPPSASRHRALDPLRTSCPSALSPGGARGSVRASLPDFSHLPSHARPTEAQLARAAGAAAHASHTHETLQQTASKTNGKYSNVASKVFDPTKAFLARVAGMGDDATVPLRGSATFGSAKLRSSAAFGSSAPLRSSAVFGGSPGATPLGSPGAINLRASQALDAILCSPAGKRVTSPRPFESRASNRAARTPRALATEEAALADAAAHAFRAHVVPSYVHEARPIEGFGRVHTTPRRPDELFEPFDLESEARRKAARARAAEVQASADAAAAAARVFHAINAARVHHVLNEVDTPYKPAPAPATVPSPPTLATDARLAHHAEVVTPQRAAAAAAHAAAKAAQVEGAVRSRALVARLAEERAARESAEAAVTERIAVLDLRRSLVFHAREMPDPAKPAFRPDQSLVAPVTTPREFKLATDERFGKKGAREDAESLVSFAASLRGGGGGGAGGGTGAIEHTRLASSAMWSPRSSVRLGPAPGASAGAGGAAAGGVRGMAAAALAVGSRLGAAMSTAVTSEPHGAAKKNKAPLVNRWLAKAQDEGRDLKARFRSLFTRRAALAAPAAPAAAAATQRSRRYRHACAGLDTASDINSPRPVA